MLATDAKPPPGRSWELKADTAVPAKAVKVKRERGNLMVGGRYRQRKPKKNDAASCVIASERSLYPEDPTEFLLTRTAATARAARQPSEEI